MVNTLAKSRIEKSEKMPNLRVHSKDYKSARILHKKSSKGTFSFTRIRVQYKVHTVHVQCILKCKQSAIMYRICEDNFKHISPQ